MPSSETLKSGETKTIEVVGKTGTNGKNYLYNSGNFTYATSGSGDSVLTIKPKTTLEAFYNNANITIKQNSKLILQLTNTNFIMDRNASYQIQKNAELEASGKEFTIYSGTLLNHGKMALSFSDSINNNFKSGSKGIINDGGILNITTKTFHNGRADIGSGSYGVFETMNAGTTTINASDKFRNFGYIFKIFDGQIVSDKNPNAISILKASLKATLTINGGDVYNGGDIEYTADPSSSAKHHYYSGVGYILADNATITIEKNLTSKGAGALLNDASEAIYSQIAVSNGGTICIGENFTNAIYSDIFVGNGGSIEVGGSFTSGANTHITFSGGAKGYGSIQANTIDITGANLIFYKGSAKTDTAYTFLKATTSLTYDNSILGIQNALAQDGSINLFYQAFIEKTNNELKLTFQDKTGGKGVSEIISQSTRLGNNERIIIDAIDKQKPLGDFDIRNFSISQIKGVASSIEKNIQDFATHKNALIKTGFQAAKTSVMNRMMKVQSLIPSPQSSPRYATNTISPYSTQSNRTDFIPQLIAFPSRQALEPNALYASILGAYQKNTAGAGYDYGFNAGYDRVLSKNLFLGLYGGYVAGDLAFDSLEIQTRTIQMGAYARFNTAFIETDMILSYSNTYSRATKTISLVLHTDSSDLKYSTQAFDYLIQSGPKIIFGTDIIKPFIGFNALYEQNNPLKENGPLGSEYLFQNDFYIGAIAGMEYRKYANGGYFFIQPSIEYTLHSNLKSTQVIFLNNTLSIPAPAKENFFSLLTGGEFHLNRNFLININASIKGSMQETFIATGSASLKFIF
ncbi:autotransporter outer membrane beta-barrel domain-containing protein [Helicobacter sp. 11S02596-1]|uniref:autotransporter outer membrane beta-barrel domain-containing protein n=1 Tax=Helicobacter sp. 11S02596-1 TaxID=1476194 RepID=UPI0015DF301D|nr:autotransporter outer membrane beta-barrel domain-containing protein [Helicobacter sp. 11S02596-1]